MPGISVPYFKFRTGSAPFVPPVVVVPLQPNVDLDKGGTAYQQIDTYLGPSLGWVKNQIKSAQTITVANTYAVVTAGVILVNVAGTVTILLPDVVPWVRESGYQPATDFEREIWVKDLGGNAQNFPITISPFGIQLIDGQTSFQIISNHFLLRLYPLTDLTGWYSG